MSTSRILVAAFFLSASSLFAEETWMFLDNGKIRVGINKTAGAAIGWFSESGREENLLNRFDYGRYLQQSWYGNQDDSDWNGKPWKWNPVQGGNWENTPGKASITRRSFSSIGAKTIPRHWASGELLEEVTYEQTVSLKDKVVVIDFKITYHGETTHRPRHQELPALFADASLSRLILPLSEKPGDLQEVLPGFPNEYFEIGAPWIAWVDEFDRGLGLYFPDTEATEVTCYRAPGDPKNRDKGACSYVAPIRTIAIAPGFEFEYRIYLFAGTLTEIQRRVQSLSATLVVPREETPE